MKKTAKKTVQKKVTKNAPVKKSKTGKKYLILGSGGQIGAALAEYVEKKGHEALRFDIVHNLEHDLRIHNNTHLDSLMKQADYVFFLAFDVGGSRYLKKYQDTYDFISNNVKLMNTAFDMIKKHNKKFIFASSQMSNMGYSNYGLLKAVGEAYTRTLGGIVVKFWNVYGLETDHEKAHVITDLIKKAESSGIIDLLTDGTEERQFLHSDDCSECLVILAEKDAKIPRDKELHVTTFEWTNILNVANIISKHFNNAPVKPAPAKDDVQKGKR
ncbi:NAD-dependent epimerase/dehydratase family protein, partial [bacterium]|nr:NAD-dependent epimerase/dehydratase family protein [bacterium]